MSLNKIKKTKKVAKSYKIKKTKKFINSLVKDIYKFEPTPCHYQPGDMSSACTGTNIYDSKGNIEKLKLQFQYETLQNILNRAFEQASIGKGKERHATNEPFEQQLICEISRQLHSFDGNIFQAIKKMIESKRLFQMREKDKAVNEILGAINYMAAAIILIEENFDKVEWYK